METTTAPATSEGSTDACVFDNQYAAAQKYPCLNQAHDHWKGV